jgi:D-alanine-D-alanine ligase
VLESMDGGRPIASAVAEIRVLTESGFYDYQRKYLADDQVDLVVPAEVEPQIANDVRTLAVRTFEAIGCEGLARVDVFLTHEGRIMINEINTMPGFTAHSMFPRMWAASGLAYPELIDRLITLALRRPVGLR